MPWRRRQRLHRLGGKALFPSFLPPPVIPNASLVLIALFLPLDGAAVTPWKVDGGGLQPGWWVRLAPFWGAATGLPLLSCASKDHAAAGALKVIYSSPWRSHAAEPALASWVWVVRGNAAPLSLWTCRVPRGAGMTSAG